MAYAGEPLANLFTLAPLSSLKLLRVQLHEGQPGYVDRIRRRDGRPVDRAELAELLAELGEHLELAQAVISDYVVAPEFTIGQHVDVVSDDGTTILERGLTVRDILEHGQVDVIDVHGNHDRRSALNLRAAD